MSNDTQSFVSVAQFLEGVDAARKVVGDGPVVMLNLLRFRDVADYSQTPHLAPSSPVTGAQAYDRYMALCEPRLKARGDKVMLMGKCGPFLIGPAEERWDAALIIWRPSLASMSDGMADDDYKARISGHRTAALLDSRLLPIAGGAAPA